MNRPVGAFPLALDLRGTGPLFLQIARALVEDVQRGRLEPGAELPGSRSLARMLGVHRNTVLMAYRELGAEGWIDTRPALGTFVCTTLPERPPRAFAALGAFRPEQPGYALSPLRARFASPVVTPAPDQLAMHGGLPDLRLVPTAALARAYRRAVRRHASTALAYGSPFGQSALRAALAHMLGRARGLAVGADGVLVTRGSQMALHLVARALLQPGDRVAVESFGYRPAWRALSATGAELVSVPVDAEGMRTDRLRARIARENLRAVYVTPHHQYPTTATMSASRRLELLELARVHRFAIIEDDYDHEFHYEGRPVLPLASADAAGVVIYVGTLSKILAPGLRLGYVVAPPPVLDRLASERLDIDRQGDFAVEMAVAELLEDGEVQRHALRMRRIYAERRQVLAELLTARLSSHLHFHLPAGGMAIWARARPGIDVDAWAAAAEARSVLVQTGRRFTFDGRARPHLRLGFAPLSTEELRRAVRTLAQCAPVIPGG